jgi:hypothetical protein
MGLATHKIPVDPTDNYAIIYYPPAPRAMIEVVDPDQPDRLVEYGRTGRVRLTTLTREFFMPRSSSAMKPSVSVRAGRTHGTECATCDRSRASRPRSWKAFTSGSVTAAPAA